MIFERMYFMDAPIDLMLRVNVSLDRINDMLGDFCYI